MSTSSCAPSLFSAQNLFHVSWTGYRYVQGNVKLVSCLHKLPTLWAMQASSDRWKGLLPYQ